MDLMYITGFILVYILACIQVISGTGLLEIKLISYFSNGEGSNGNCCDGKWIVCPSDCDFRFRLCVDRPFGSDALSDCQFGQYQTGTILDKDNIGSFPSYIGSVKNHFPFKFTEWPGQFKLKVYVDDEDDINSHDHVDTLIRTINRLPSQTRELHPVTIQHRTTLIVGVRVKCDAYFYTSSCSVYCKPHNDPVNGFYTCNKSTGTKICKQGYTGDSCNIDIDECQDSPCQNNGTCVNQPGTYTCTCLENYSGMHCEITPVCSSQPCLNNGVCIEEPFRSFSCNCSVGYSGSVCETRIDPCMCNPCLNNGTCISDTSSFNYTCSCTSQWLGITCEKPLPPPYPITLIGDQTRITLVGEINKNNRDDLVNGLKNISTIFGNITGDLVVQIKTKTFLLKPDITLTEVNFLVAIEKGEKVIDQSTMDNIFEKNKGEDLNPYLPLPLYEPEPVYPNDPSKVTGVRPDDANWALTYWYIFFIIILICIASVAVFVFVFLRKRRSRQEKVIIADYSSPTQDMAFENVLYNDNNQANANRDRPVPPTPALATTLSREDEQPEDLQANGAAGGIFTTNIYETPKVNHYQDIDGNDDDDDGKPDAPPRAGPYLDMNGTNPRSVDNTYQDFDKLAEAMNVLNSESHTENPYQDLDKVKGEMDSDVTDSESEDEIDKIKASFK